MVNFLKLLFTSNLGPILHRFEPTARFMCSWPHPYSNPILGVFPLNQIAHVGVSERMGLRLFGREIIFEEFQPICSRCLNVTDERTTCNLITAFCASIARQKHYWVTHQPSIRSAHTAQTHRRRHSGARDCPNISPGAHPAKNSQMHAVRTIVRTACIWLSYNGCHCAAKIKKKQERLCLYPDPTERVYEVTSLPQTA